ncbi:MAG: peroxiredoxin [Sphingobacteriia bacterium]|jgi:peroxiredoxin (alkyl hydroperoxide reductase subunit C)
MSVLVGKKAPDFSATAVVNGGDMVEDFTLSQFQGNKYVVLFFYPLDFTFVCPTEILEFQNHLQEFRKLDAEVVGVSIDSQFSHWAWLNTPKDKGGIQGVQFPLVADLTKTIAKNYDVLAGDYYSEIDDNDNEQLGFKGAPVAYRGTFIIDKAGVVQHQLVNNLPLGRNIGETLRTLKALKHVEQYGEVCPANWDEGKDAMKATAAGVASYLATH